MVRPMPTPQPTPAAKNAIFAAVGTSGQRITEKAAAKIKNMIAMGIELERRVIGFGPLSVELVRYQVEAICDG